MTGPSRQPAQPIQVWDYPRHDAAEEALVRDAVGEVYRSGRLILGEQVARFEAAFAAWCGVEHGVGVNSGTDALFIGLKALGIGVGDEVITVANTAVPTVSAVISTGAVARFVDVEPSTMLMDASRLEDAVSARTRAIVAVHLYGQCVAMEKVREVASRHGLAVIEDCAQAHGATRDGVKAGAMSDLAAFSFYPTKILGGIGDGGLIATRDKALAARARRLRMYGMDGQYRSDEHGYNSRLDEVQAAVLLRRLPGLDAALQRRRGIAAHYTEHLASLPIGLPHVSPGNVHAWYLYVIRHPARDRLIEALAARSIALTPSYRWPIHLMAGYRHLGYREGDLPATEAAARQVLSLPTYPTLSRTDQEAVCRALAETLEDLGAP